MRENQVQNFRDLFKIEGDYQERGKNIKKNHYWDQHRSNPSYRFNAPQDNASGDHGQEKACISGTDRCRKRRHQSLEMGDVPLGCILFLPFDERQIQGVELSVKLQSLQPECQKDAGSHQQN
jgi:hypothetical protein